MAVSRFNLQFSNLLIRRVVCFQNQLRDPVTMTHGRALIRSTNEDPLQAIRIIRDLSIVST